MNGGLRCSYVGSGGDQIRHDDELFHAVMLVKDKGISKIPSDLKKYQ